MIKLPDEAPNALVALCQQLYDHKSTGSSVAHDVWQDCLDELRPNATAQPVSDKPSLKAMMRALDAFYADESVPETAMMKAFRILLADIMPAAPGGQDEQ